MKNRDECYFRTFLPIDFYNLVQLIASENFLLNLIKKISENPKGDMIHN